MTNNGLRITAGVLCVVLVYEVVWHWWTHTVMTLDSALNFGLLSVCAALCGVLSLLEVGDE